MPETLKCPVCSNTGFRIEWKYVKHDHKTQIVEYQKQYIGHCANCKRKVLLGVG